MNSNDYAKSTFEAIKLKSANEIKAPISYSWSAIGEDDCKILKDAASILLSMFKDQYPNNFIEISNDSGPNHSHNLSIMVHPKNL